MAEQSSPFHVAPPDGEYYVFRDPIHNLIEIDNELEGRFLRRVLGTRELQRLRHLKQNGLGNLVYLGLEGSRFSHSLGSYHIARRLIQSLRERQPKSQEEFPRFLQITERDCVAFSIAALLHDIGHGPLSHVWEELFETDHEATGLSIVKAGDTEIGAILANTDEFPELHGIH
jgi:HD superfamily phosphohydrolase